MVNFEEFSLSVLKKIYLKFRKSSKYSFKNKNVPKLTSQDASDLIRDLLEGDRPCMIARFGSIELDCVNFFKIYNSGRINRYKNFIVGQINSIYWEDKLKYKISNNAGFFPTTDLNLDKFSKLMIEEMKQVDVLGSWLNKENNFTEELKNSHSVRLGDLVPFIHKFPWSYALKDKTVLVIHPFVESISYQFKRKKLLFKNQQVLPDFKLITYMPVQSYLNNYKNLEFRDWFEALEKMKKEISNFDFDIAIIGCGAFGFPLASFIKKIGKKSVHLGGATQLMFGITGKRWEQEYDYDHYINKNWIRPSLNERPVNFQKVENGCYW